MFTGIIESVGTVLSITPQSGDMRLTIDTAKLDLKEVHIGDSIAVNGVCLTVIQFDKQSFSADVSLETLSLTSLKQLKAGSPVNLEKALTLATRLGGHLVSGHVDGLAQIIEHQNKARSIHFRVQAPNELARYIAHKGSVTIDGVSLTVNAVDGAIFELNIVPHTLQETIMKHYQIGTQVNLEVDLLARYLERLVLGDKAAHSIKEKHSLTMDTLSKSGFA